MKSLAEILLEEKLLTPEQLSRALAARKESGKRLDRVLLDSGVVDEKELLERAAGLVGARYTDRIDERSLDPDILTRVPREFALRNNLLPLRMADGRVVVATSDPLNLAAIDEVASLFKADVDIVVAAGEEVVRAIHHSYPLTASPEEAVEDLSAGELELAGAVEDSGDLLDMASQAPIIRLVNTVLYRAVSAGASDVHIQPSEDHVKVRFRLDGMLHDVLDAPRQARDAITSRVKIMSHLNVAERRLPQDGRATIRVSGRAVDIRVSIIPTAYGERVVLRLLDKENLLLGLEELGMDGARLVQMDQLIRIPHGIIFVTGPTGSGKTTTLYAALSRINSPEKNIITIEDPIEYHLGGVSQIQVKPAIGLTFADGLRSMVRQDPDIIMVGEVRDRETAEISIHAALTGHLVFSTLHTNDAAGAVTRLLEMGVEPYLVSSTVTAVLAQRLVRLVHRACSEEHEPAEDALVELGLEESEVAGKRLARGRGCEECLNTGYRGRTGVYELMVLDDELREMILKHAAAGDMEKAAVRKGMVTLRKDGVRKALDGVTTIEEVLRVTRE